MTLTERDLFRPEALEAPAHRFESTGDPALFAKLAQRFLGPEAAAAGALAEAAA